MAVEAGVFAGWEVEMLLRVAAGVLLLGAAVLSVLALVDYQARGSDLDAVLTLDAVNQRSADSAPQQSVVNGWTARDLYALGLQQQNGFAVRTGIALSLGVAGVALLLWSSARVHDYAIDLQDELEGIGQLVHSMSTDDAE